MSFYTVKSRVIEQKTKKTFKLPLERKNPSAVRPVIEPIGTARAGGPSSGQ